MALSKLVCGAVATSLAGIGGPGENIAFMLAQFVCGDTVRLDDGILERSLHGAELDDPARLPIEGRFGDATVESVDEDAHLIR